MSNGGVWDGPKVLMKDKQEKIWDNAVKKIRQKVKIEKVIQHLSKSEENVSSEHKKLVTCKENFKSIENLVKFEEKSEEKSDENFTNRAENANQTSNWRT